MTNPDLSRPVTDLLDHIEVTVDDLGA